MERYQSMLLALTSGDWLIDPRWALSHLEELDAIRLGIAQTDKPNRQPLLSLMALQDGSMAAQTGSDLLPDDTVAVIQIRQVIQKYSSWYAVGSKEYAGLINSLYANKQIAGIVLVMDTPGGQASGTREVYETVANPIKDVITVADGLIASAGFYYAAPSTAIYASQKTDWIGSIGTYAMYADWVAYYKKIGLPVHEIYAEQSTEKNLPWRQLFGEGKSDLLVQDLTAFNQIFLDDVKAARGDKLKVTAEVDPYKGGIFYADPALSIGLIDGYSTVSDAVLEILDRKKTKSKSSISNMGLKAKILAFLNSEEEEQESATETPAAPTSAAPAPAAPAPTAAAPVAAAPAAEATELEQLRAQVSTLTTERDTYKTQAEKFGNQPGALPTKAATDKSTEGEGGNDWQKVLNELPHNKAAAQINNL